MRSDLTLDAADEDQRQPLGETEEFLRTKFPGARFILIVDRKKSGKGRMHMLAGPDRMRRDAAIDLLRRMHAWLMTGLNRSD